MTAIDLLHDGFINLQKENRRRITVKEYADFLGENESSLNLMMNGKRTITKNKLIKFGEKLQDERFYKLAGENPPDPDLVYIQTNWKDFDPEFKTSLRIQAEKYEEKNRKKKK